MGLTAKAIAYQDGDKSLEGYFWGHGQPRPTVVLCHAWAGLDDFIKKRAELVASWGYNAFALDLYGKGVLGKSIQENSALMNPFLKDRKMLRKRLKIGLDRLKEEKEVKAGAVAAIGFCFGGLCVLDMARMGEALKGVVSVHGIFKPAEGIPNVPKIGAKILALHGYNDPSGPPETVARFQDELTRAGADWQMHTFSHTMHAFTNPEANAPEIGNLYNPSADKRSWIQIRAFLEEVFS